MMCWWATQALLQLPSSTLQYLSSSVLQKEGEMLGILGGTHMFNCLLQLLSQGFQFLLWSGGISPMQSDVPFPIDNCLSSLLKGLCAVSHAWYSSAQELLLTPWTVSHSFQERCRPEKSTSINYHSRSHPRNVYTLDFQNDLTEVQSWFKANLFCFCKANQCIISQFISIATWCPQTY